MNAEPSEPGGPEQPSSGDGPAPREERFSSEMEKKQILLHCLVEDMNAALGNIITSLRLMETKPNPAHTQQLIGLALQATETQRSLIDRILALYGDELKGLYGRDGETQSDTDLRAIVHHASTGVAESFTSKGVRLDLPSDRLPDLRVCADAGHVERVLSSLLDRAMQQAAPGGKVTLQIEDETRAAVVRVHDDGPALAPETRERLFLRLEAPVKSTHGPFLRFHFCRIAVEGCGGEIGYAAPEHGGNCYWIRLPKTGAER